MTYRVAIVGANGQVGAELALILKNFPELSLVPISRSRRGSAYLRWKGIACRHGTVSDANEAPALIGDCDLILNLALPSGLPREIRKESQAIIESCARYAKQGAKIVYFSTQSVYGAAAPDDWMRWRNGYGREKLRGEGDARRAAATHDRKLWILRLGHVCGELQSISLTMRRQMQEGPVRLADGGLFLSNCTHVATIAGVVLAFSRGSGEPPGTYDLMDVPHRNWREVYQWEASRAGVSALIESVPARHRKSPFAGLKHLLMSPLRGRAANPVFHELGLQILALLPSRWGKSLQAAYFRRRAAGEVAALTREEATHEASDWRAVEGPFFVAGLDTVKCLSDPAFFPQIAVTPSPFPPDLPPASI
ncbi:MAG: NAD(P)-dependent oxidoreductase [Gammaproteobacteria bacterium]|nr:NAD(P)-dependent oxidoreductase [Gammaproteobacteria bacterium]